MHNTPQISVIVPAYNAESTLVKCVNSLLAQTHKNLDIILVNDCSTDNTPSICEQLASKNSNVRAVHLAKNSGLSQARNAGLDIATGEWIAFVDSDDWIEPETYQTALEYAKKYSAKYIIWSYISEYGDVLKEKHIYDTDMIFKDEQSENIFYDTLGSTGKRLSHPEFIHSLSTVCCKLFFHETILKNKLKFYDLEKIGAEDLYFSAQYINCISGETSVYIDQCFYHYIKANQNSLSTKYKPSYAQMAININKELERLVENRKDKEICLKALNNRRALSLINIGLNEISANDNMFTIIKRLKNIVYEKQFHKAFSELDFFYLPIKWKIFFGTAKLKFTLALYILLKTMALLLTKND